MRVLLFGSSREGSLTWCCRRALDRLGHDTALVDIGSIEPKSILEQAKFHTVDRYRFNRRIRSKAGSFDADMFFLPGWNKYVSDRTLSTLRAQGVTTANWFPDDLYRSPAQAERGALFDRCYIIGDYPEDDLRGWGVENSAFLTFGYDPDLHRPMDAKEEYAADIGFIGTYTENRGHVLKRVAREFPDQDLTIIGNGWDAAPAPVREHVVSDAVYGEEYVRALNSVDIALNMHQPFNTPRGGPNMRLFELAGSGVFGLHDHKPEMEHLFVLDEELVVYNDVDDLLDKLSYYLDHPEEREQIVNAAFRKAEREHTYEQRMTEVVNDLSA